MGPSQYAVIGDTVKKGVSNMFDRRSNKKQLATQREGLAAQEEYINGRSQTMKDDYSGEMQPYTEAGSNATSNLSDMDMDVGSSDPMQSRQDYKFQMGDFKADPGYQFRLSQGVGAADQGAAGNSLYSGGQSKELMEYGQNLGSEEYSKVYDRDFGEFQDMNSQYQDARDYNTDLDVGNMNRDVNNQQFLSGQGANASGRVADASLDINQDQTQFGVGNIAAMYGNTADKTANKYGFWRDQNEIAGDGFTNYMGSMSGGGGASAASGAGSAGGSGGFGGF